MSGTVRLVYLAFVRFPTEKAHGAQIVKTCEALAKAGVSVELVVPGRETTIVEDAFVYYGVEKNFTLTTLGTLDWVRYGFVGYAVSALWFSERAKWMHSFWTADVVYSRDAFVLVQYILLGRKLVYEAHTQPTALSRFVARRAFRVVAISEALRDAYIRAGAHPDRILVAHDAVDVATFQSVGGVDDARAALGIQGMKKIALYVGRIEKGKGANTFAEASALVPSDWECVLVGDGPSIESLKKKYPQARFIPQTPYRDLSKVLAAGDVLVLPNSAEDKNASLFTSPLKAFAYLASGKPILASRVPALEQVFIGQPGVTYFDPDSATSLAQNLASSTSPSAPFSRTVYSWADRAVAIRSFLFD